MIVIPGGTRDDSDGSIFVADDVVFRTLTTREIVAAILFCHTAWVVLLAWLARGIETLVFYIFTWKQRYEHVMWHLLFYLHLFKHTPKIEWS